MGLSFFGDDMVALLFVQGYSDFLAHRENDERRIARY
jgi:hypothetical protein